MKERLRRDSALSFYGAFSLFTSHSSFNLLGLFHRVWTVRGINLGEGPGKHRTVT